ncbi:MAG TPA: alpha-amylase family glycosyl hydrolase, partial [Microthrixaceae bacterium]|nr:alpha-amylase family glycosyl hydrolase [Microthrixaceae bacterium]
MTSPPPRPPRSHPPIATYRLQLRDGLTLDDVRERWLDPLADLGVSHLYLSPVFTAAAASTHGYDVVDPNVVDPVLSATGADGDAAFVALSEAAAERGLRIMIDLVPNHAATDHDRNARWWDLLRNGPASADAGWFDLDWDVPERRLRGRLLLPVLGDHYGRELEQSAFSLAIEDVHGMPEVVLVHPSTTTPLELSSLAPLLRASGSTPLAELAAEIETLPGWSLPHDPDELATRRRVEPDLRRQVGAALADPDVATALTATLERVSTDVDTLDTLIEAQPYRLARWQTSLEDLSYRRFFDINSLIGVRVDRPDVFDRSHEAVRRWVGAGLVDG